MSTPVPVNEKVVAALFTEIRRGTLDFYSSDRSNGWKLVQKCLPKILEYGRSEGILQTRENKVCSIWHRLFCWYLVEICSKESPTIFRGLWLRPRRRRIITKSTRMATRCTCRQTTLRSCTRRFLSCRFRSRFSAYSLIFFFPVLVCVFLKFGFKIAQNWHSVQFV